MRLSKKICAIAIAIAVAILCNNSFAQDQKKEILWTGTLRDGTKINVEDLKKIIADHKKWGDTSSKAGKEAILYGASLQNADLRKADLRQANLRKANLQKANLQEADLGAANLIETDLRAANLQKANLQKASLWAANLQGTDLWAANLQEAELYWADLQKAMLQSANLQGADLRAANLQEAVLRIANLQEVYLWGANLKKADLEAARLQKADLEAANLQEASLLDANLQEASLLRTNLQKANLVGAKLGGTLLELSTDGLPDIPSIAKAYGLAYLRYRELPHTLVELREGFKKAGLRKQEREVTYAIKHTGFLKAKSEGDWLTRAEVCLGWIFFELTCKWGMAPERPLFILVGLIFLFTMPYAQAISQNIDGKQKTDGIWKVWIPGRIRDDLGKENPKTLLDSINSGFCFRLGFYFSLLSAFNIGWRELNVGNWIARIQPYEYRLQASGWARSVSGIQSIISVYLLALSILTYFGRPFEAY